LRPYLKVDLQDIIPSNSSSAGTELSLHQRIARDSNQQVGPVSELHPLTKDEMDQKGLCGSP
jgi:hypothetical protein